MTKILMSFQPKWVAKILDGEKTIEVRKHQFKTGDEIYMYCTKDRKHSYAVCEYQKGKVVAKFVVGEVYKIEVDSEQHKFWSKKETCMSLDDFIVYCGGNDLYAHEITNLQIFDKPKELGEFKKWVKKTIYCGMDCPPYEDDVLIKIEKAPKNFMYVEEKE